jgi:glucosamine--fructose-6-phosphate aminotransferase (isomerizing)
MAKSAGALTAALVNDTESPLAAACDVVLPMTAGPERSVAATKTFIASLSALLRLVALWSEDRALSVALDQLPDRLVAAVGLDWGAAATALARAPSLIAIGRGPTLAIARESALKLKEIANLHAEAFSGAEFLHGPVALVSTEYPILMFVPGDEAAGGLRRLGADLAGKGAALFIADPDGGGILPMLPADHPEADALCQIQSFYAMMVGLAERLGIDPDRPRHLQKVTRTR